MSAFAPGARGDCSASSRNAAPTAAAAHSAAAASAREALDGSTGGEGGDGPLSLTLAVAAGAVMPTGGCFRVLTEEREGNCGVLSQRGTKTTAP